MAATSTRWDPARLSLAALLISTGAAITGGRFLPHDGPLAVAVLPLALLLSGFALALGAPPGVRLERAAGLGAAALRAGLLVGAIVQFLLVAALARQLPTLRPLTALLAAAVLAAVLWAYAPRWRGRLWLPAVGIAIAARALMLWGIPKPGIDTFWVLQRASQLLLSGHDPFLATAVSGVAPSMVSGSYPHILPFPYWPSTALLSALSYALTSDVRWVNALASLLPAVAAYRLARPAGLAEARSLALAVLFLPGALLVVMSGWNEPLMLGFLSLGVLLSSRPQHRLAQAACWAGLWASKPSALLLALPLGRRLGVRVLALSLGLAGGLCLVFLLWGPREFFQGPVIYQLQSPMRHDGLTLTALVYALNGYQLPALVMAAFTAALVVWCLLRSDGTWAGSLGAAGAMQVALFIVNKWGFANYYFLAGALLWLACAAALGEGPRSSTAAAATLRPSGEAAAAGGK